MTNSKRSAGFSLVELLVVITIIVVLVALLLPAIQGAKARAKGVKCSNNQKQISGAFINYLNDNSGYYPYVYPECSCTNIDPVYQQWYCQAYQGTAYCISYSPPSLNAGGWNYVIAPYLGCSIAALQTRIGCNTCNIVGCCPATVVAAYKVYSDQMFCASNPWGFPAGGYRLSSSSYTLNLNNFPETWRCGGANSCGSGPNNAAGWARRVNMSDIAHASGVMLMGETPLDGNVMDNPWGIANGGAWGYTLPYPSGSGVSAEAVTNTTAWGGPLPDARTWLRADCNAYVSTFHGGSMNVLYADGHVGRVSKGDLLQYSAQKWTAANGPNLSNGGIFWTDGKGTVNGSPWYYNQFPGGTYPN